MPFELTIDPSILTILAVVAFLAGSIDATAGGGGPLTIPVLFTAGVLPHLALGTNKLSSVFGAAAASYTFYRRKLFHPGKWRNAPLATAIGAAIGAWVAHLLPAEWPNRMLPVVVFTCGLYALFGGTPKAPLDADVSVGRKHQRLQGLALGLYDGAAGPGTGAFWTVSSLLMYPLNLVRASGAAWSMNFVSNIVALAVLVVSGQVIWLLNLCMGASLTVGAYFGARTVVGDRAKFTRPVFIPVVLALTARLAWQYWFNGA